MHENYVLLTRSETENIRLATLLQSYNIKTISCPQIIQKEIDLDFSTYKNFKIVIITSKFAAKILAKKINWEVRVYVVGTKSAEILSNNKFLRVEKIFQTASELNKFFASSYSCNYDNQIQKSSSKYNLENVVYFSGNNITQHIPCLRVAIYNTEYINDVSQDIASMIRDGKILAILIYSYKTALSLKQAIKYKNLTQYMTNIYIIALSPNIALEFIELNCKILYSKNKNEVEMIKILTKITHESEKETF